MLVAFSASRWNARCERSASLRVASTMPSAITSVASASGNATAPRRGAQASRGGAMKDQTIGAPISTPSVSPTHHAPQVAGSAAALIVPLASSTSTAIVALVTQVSGATSNMKRARSAGSDSSSGIETKRRTIQAPKAACNAAPAPAPSHVAMTTAPSVVSAETCHKLAASDAAATATTAQRPQTNAAARPTPAAGNSGEALLG